jgi:hypothetical protein
MEDGMPSKRCRCAAVSFCGLLLTSACSPLLETGGPNAVGVHVARASYDPGAPPSTPDEAQLADAFGARVSYSRRLAGGLKAWVGPELMAAKVGESKISASHLEYPAGVSRSYAAALVRANAFLFPKEGGAVDNFFGRLGIDVGAGVAWGRFEESHLRIDGTTNPDPVADSAFGPTATFGLDLRLSKNVILRGDAYFLFVKPQLSFPWPDRTADKVIAGGGLLVVF